MAQRDSSLADHTAPTAAASPFPGLRLRPLVAKSIGIYPIACAVAIVVGLSLRAWPVLAADFPLNDGGLFLQMTEELRRARYRLPEFTAYNDAGIPFAYAPFAFYVAAILADLGVPLLTVFRFLPLLAAACCIGAVLLLAHDILRSRTAIVAAVVSFALVPRSWVWLVMGGGLTRSFGLLFAILAIREANRLYSTRRRQHAITAGLFAGLTVLSHLGTAPFAAFSILLFLVARGRHREGLVGTVVLGVVAVVVSAPWWATVLATHGIEPFLAAQRTGGTVFTPGPVGHTALVRLANLGLFTTGESLFPMVAVLGLAGALSALAGGPVVLPAWWVATLALDARAGETYATVPLALLAGLGVRVLLASLEPPVREADVDSEPGTPLHPSPGETVLTHARRALPWAVAAFMLLYTGLGVLRDIAERQGEIGYLRSLTVADREAMAWIARETPEDIRVLVIPPVAWPTDRHSEWFPVLAGRPSILTVQGREWNPGGDFHRHEQLHFRLLECRDASSTCLEDWVRGGGLPFGYVFVPGSPTEGCCGRLRESLRGDARYRLVYEGEGGQLFEREGGD